MSHSTQDLLLRARQGDAAAYDELFGQVAERVLRYVRLRLGPGLTARLDPLDVVQETYLEAHRSFERFTPDGDGAFPRWLYGIVDNRIGALARHHKAQKRSAPAGIVRESQVLARLRASQTGPGTAAGRDEAHDRLQEAMAELGEDERNALLLRFFQELTIEQVAESLGRSATATRRLLARAQLKLGRQLGGDGIGALTFQ